MSHDAPSPVIERHVPRCRICGLNQAVVNLTVQHTDGKSKPESYSDKIVMPRPVKSRLPLAANVFMW